MLIFKKFITREFVRESFPNTIFLFGDNMQRTGFGGQAKEMRGEPNAFGVPTKWKPTMQEDAFFTDNDFINNKDVQKAIVFPFVLAYNWMADKDNIVCLPEDGLGTGLSQLETRAPLILSAINLSINNLKNHPHAK